MNHTMSSMVMMENDCHTMIIVWSYYEQHVGDYDYSMIEHVRKFPKIRLSPSGAHVLVVGLVKCDTMYLTR